MNNDIIFFKEVVFLDLNKKVAFVTGASIGLGKGLIEELSKNGCNVVIGYNNSKEKAEWLKKYIEEKYNVKALSIKCDVTDENSIKNTITYIVDNFGKIDIVINNAAYAQDNYIYDKTKEEFMKVLETNLVGPFLVSKYAYKYMNDGIIVNISSKDAVSTYNDISMDYCASKAGLNSLTKTSVASCIKGVWNGPLTASLIARPPNSLISFAYSFNLLLTMQSRIHFIVFLVCFHISHSPPVIIMRIINYVIFCDRNC